MSSDSTAFAFMKRNGLRIFLPAIVLLAVVAALIFQKGGMSSFSSGAEFAQRQKVSVNSELRFGFPVAMDHASVQEAIDAPESLQGSWRWENEMLVFKPSAPLKTGESYSFVLSRDALTSEGEALGRDLEFVFTVSGPPQVVAMIPGSGSLRIPPQSKITLVFDRAMVPLAQVQGEVTKENVSDWPVTITPAVEGRWRWMSTVAREFIPAKGLTAGTRYTVRVPKGLVSVAGDATDKEYVWNFETLRPEVVSATPEAGDKLAGPGTVISLTFNREVDLQSAAGLVSLLKQTGAQADAAMQAAVVSVPQGAKMPLKEVKYGTKEVNEKKVTDKTTIVLVPSQPLAFSTSYAVYAAAGIRGLEGDLGMSSGFTLRFGTVGDLKVELGRYEQQYGNELQIDFSNPIDPDTLKSGIVIKPAPENAKEMEWSVYEWSGNRQARLYPELKPSTEYTVTVGKGVRDAFGQTMKEPHSFTFTTASVKPEVYIHSKGQFGIFEKGKPPVFYLNSVNVSEVNLAFAKLTLSEFLSMSGPYNEGDSAWQRMQSINGRKLANFKPAAPKDQWKSVPFDVAKEFGDLQPGIYALAMTAPEAVEPYNPSQKQIKEQYFAITNMAVTLKYSGDKALVWVTDMQTGNPVKGARIVFHNQNGNRPVSGVTDEQGFFESAMNIKDFATPNNDWEPEFWVTAETDTDFAFVSSLWNDGVRPYNFEFFSDFRSPMSAAYRLDSYVYTERPIYKAGDTVNFKGMTRLRDWTGGYAMPSDRKAVVRVTDAQGSEIFNKDFPINEFGAFHGSFPIDAKAALGGYYMYVQLTPDTEIGNNYANASFSVLAYRKPEYKVEVLPESEDYFDGDSVKASVEGSYYFGAPMGGAKVQWRAQTTDYYFNKFTDGWYMFSLEDSWCWYSCERQTEQIAQGEGTLDATGRLQLSIPVSLQQKALSQVLSIEADITDANNQVVSSRGSAVVHKADAYVGVRSEEYVVTPGSPAAIGVVTVKTDGTPLPNQSVKVQLYSRTWNTIRKKGVDGEYYYENEPKDTFIRESSVTTDEKGKATASVLVGQGGEYRVVAVVRDSRGREAKAGTSVYAWSSSYVNWPRTNSDRMDVIADKPEYKVGEKATILVKSPYQGKGVKALVTVEREGVITRKVVDVESNAQSIEVPITQDLIPNAYVSVVVVKPRMGETFNENGLDTGAPAYKIGYAKLNVDTFSKRLNIDIQPDKQQYLPGEKVTVKLKTTDAFGAPVSADVSLGVVDMSLLALSSFETPDLVRLFYSERGLGVYTSQMLSQLLERFKPGSKGGGGGDPAERARGNFKDTAYWQPSTVTNAQGEATLSFVLPDNLTTWQLLAIGSTKQHTFGSLAKTILETKNVIIRPVRPRFAVRGDKIELGAIVHNFLPEIKTFTVTLTGKGFSGSSDPQTVVVKPGAQAKLSFPVVAGAGTGMTMTFSAKTDGAVDTVIEKIPVHEFGTMQSVATSGVTDTTALEKVLVPSVKDAKDGTLSVAVSPSMAAYLPGGLQYLSHYPYGCTEQTLSSFVPALALSRLQGFDQLQFVNRKELEKNVIAGMERIYRFQRADGGFGYWEDSQESYPYLSAYVLFALDLAKDSGQSVDLAAMGRVADYLQTVLRSQDPNKPLDLATRAYILYSLSEYGRGDLALLNNLYEKRNQLPLFAKAHLIMAYQTMKSTKRAADMLADLQNAARVDSRGTHFEEGGEASYGYLMNTNERTTALVLQAMLRVDPDNPLIPNVVRYLLAVRNGGHWDTTQSTVHALLAFADYLDFTQELEPSYDAGIKIGGATKLTWKVGKDQALQRREVTMALDELARGKQTDILVAKEGKGRLYYDAQLSYFFTGDTIAPAEEGIGISRSFKPLSGKSTALKVGQTYLMTVTVTVPEDRNFVAVESPVPAGMELVDLQLETSQQNLLSGLSSDTTLWSWDSWEKGLWRFSHREYRDDQLFLFADQLPAGVYEYRALVRATQPGQFRQRPARAYEMYFPEVFGQTEGGWVTISE